MGTFNDRTLPDTQPRRSRSVHLVLLPRGMYGERSDRSVNRIEGTSVPRAENSDGQDLENPVEEVLRKTRWSEVSGDRVRGGIALVRSGDAAAAVRRRCDRQLRASVPVEGIVSDSSGLDPAVRLPASEASQSLGTPARCGSSGREPSGQNSRAGFPARGSPSRSDRPKPLLLYIDRTPEELHFVPQNATQVA